MQLRSALELCTEAHSHEWVEIPSGGWGRPATTMVAGIFDPGGSDPETRPLMGHSLAIYEPDARLSLVWPVPEDTDYLGRIGEREMPEWAELEHISSFKNATPGWTVVLLSGTPIWQQLMWYLDWGSGIGGYVPNFRPRFGDDEDGAPTLEGWEVSAWAVAITRLVNSFSHTDREWMNVDPTLAIVPSPSGVHPIDAARGD